MINTKNFTRRTDLLINYILQEKRSREDYTYWSLYLDDERKNPREIDTCATSFCISLLILNEDKAKESFQSNRDIIQSALNTIIKIRRKNGCWPSVVAPKMIFQDQVITDGEVALGDTCFALNALLDAGFLKKNFEYYNLVEKQLIDLDNRIDFLFQSVRWLLDNKSHEHSKGWFYTNTSDKHESVPTMLATANVTLLFGRFINELEVLRLSDAQKAVLVEIKKAFNSAIDFTLININTDGGIGRIISRSSRFSTSYVHTARLVDMLMYRNNEDDSDELEAAINYLVNHYEMVSKNNFAEADFYSEQYRLVLKDGDEIIISHENYLEGILLNTFINIVNKSDSKESICSKIAIDRKRLESIIDRLISSLEGMQTRNGAFNGVFKCRVSRPEGKHPIYANLIGFQALTLYNSVMINGVKEIDEDSNYKCLAKCQALRGRLIDAINQYGLNSNYVEMTKNFQRSIVEIDEIMNELNNGCTINRANEMDILVDRFAEYYSNMVS